MSADEWFIKAIADDPELAASVRRFLTALSVALREVPEHHMSQIIAAASALAPVSKRRHPAEVWGPS